VGQIVAIRVDIADPVRVRAALEGADAAVNLVGILYPSAGRDFHSIHTKGAENIAIAAAATGIKALVHVSAIGADANSSALYARSKAAGEAAVRRVFPQASILRPSIVFGPEDGFFNRFAAMARCSPALPLIGGGMTRFQPIYVGDVAAAIEAALVNPDAAGKVFELGGPRACSFRELMQLLLATIGRKRALVNVPWGIARLQGAVLGLLPKPPLTADQVRLLERDNVVTPGALGLADLGLEPTPLESVLPAYLARYRKAGILPSPT
jgi:uncharacterized protein YbjT (DUF2867 family)